MKSTYVLLLLSIFTATIAVGVVGSSSHDGATMAGRSTVAVATNEQPLKRHLYPQRPRRQQQQQQTLNYRANYTADFQHLVHPTCTGDKPFLAIGCYGQSMTILNVSDPSIKCSNQSIPEFEGTSYVCQNTCTEGNTCANVYMVNDAVSNAFDGPHGSIQFLCEGNTAHDVEALFLLHSRNTIGTCSADPTATTQSNLRVARLGVSCPKMDTLSDTERNYVYDDTYFECRGESSILSGDTASPPNDAYACFNGQNCKGSACNFTFSQMTVLTHVPSFANECVEALVPIDGFPTPAPQAETSLYRVRFEALWITLNPDISSCMTTSDANPAIQIACDSNFESTIVFVRATDTTMNCINKKENVLECTGDPTQSINRFTTVEYDCFSSIIPSSTVTYPDSSAYCENNVNETNISNWVSLGIMCGNKIFSIDRYLECSDSHHNFIIEDDLENLPVGSRYFCSENTAIARNSLASNLQNIRNVSITTEEYWQSNADASCYQPFNVDTTRPPVTIHVPVPTFAPNQATAQPKPAPTVAPEIDIPIATPSVVVPDIVTPVIAPPVLPGNDAPVAAPRSPTNLFSSAPNVPTSDTLTTPSKGDSKNDKVLIFAAVGGVVGGIIVSVLLFMVYNKGKNDAVAEDKDEAFPPGKDQNDTDNNTESHHSPSMEPSSNQTADSGSPTILSVAALASPIEATPSDFYEVDYKDQSRSVIGTVSGRTQSGRTSNSDKTPLVPVLARYNKAENVKNAKPTSGIEIPTVTAIMCTDISMLGESDSTIRRFADSNSSLRMLGQSNRSFRLTTASNSSIPTESDTDYIYSDTRKEPPASSILADSNSSLQMVGEFNRSFHILDDSSSTIPTESNTHSNDYNRKKPAFADPNSSFRLVDESNRSVHALEDSNSTIPTLSNTFSNNYNRKNTVEDSNSSLRMVGESNLGESNSTIRTESNTESKNYNKKNTVEDSNSSLRMVGESNRSFHNLGESNSTIRTESNTESNNSMRKKPAYPSSALEL